LWQDWERLGKTGQVARMGNTGHTTARRCPFFEKYFFKKFEKFKQVFKKKSKIFEKKSTKQFVLSNHCFWFKTSTIAL
jgi:D-alanyl-D-alanine carboxypeptidase